MGMYVGVDYHKKYSYLAVMDETGKAVREGRVENAKEAVARFLTRAHCNGNAAAVLEATRNWTVMYDWLEELVEDVHLAHPLKVEGNRGGSDQDGQVDARVLAHMLRTDLLPEAYVPSAGAREGRSVLRQRMFLVRGRTRVKNRIGGLVDRDPALVDARPGKDLFSQESRAWLRALALKPPDLTLLEEDLALLEELDRHIARSEAVVEELAQGDGRVDLLKTILGLGAFFAVLVASEVDDIRRFAHEKKFFSSIGLIPSTYSSGGRTVHGRLTKQGNKYLRWALVEAVWPAIRTDGEVRAYYERIRARKGPNPAKVATARRLATMVYRVLSQRRPYRPEGQRGRSSGVRLP